MMVQHYVAGSYSIYFPVITNRPPDVNGSTRILKSPDNNGIDKTNCKLIIQF